MNSVASELEKWLRKEALERRTAASSRREYARAGVSATSEERKAAHALTEKMLGRKILMTSRSEDENAAAIQERIAVKIGREADMIEGFADFVASELRAAHG